jgi:threonine aldolase
MPDWIDLRSDTVTKPTPGMRRAMAEAEVGDDCYREDPTVNRLEAMTAELLGKQAALYVPSGTMANQVAVCAQTQPGQEVIVEATSHIYSYERGGLAANSGVQARTVLGQRGIPDPDDIAAAIRFPFSVHPKTALVCLEITSNRGGGSICPMETVRRIVEIARAAGVRMHLDGARLLNACIATGLKPPEYTQYFDSTTLCFSKGLGAPVGSAIAGERDFIERCRFLRGRLGGAMRQAGIIAAGAVYALQHHVDRLAEDHLHARLLAEALAEMGVDVDPPETNIVNFTVRESKPVVDALRERGVLMGAISPTRVRAVTHLDVSRATIDRAINALRRVLG